MSLGTFRAVYTARAEPGPPGAAGARFPQQYSSPVWGTAENSSTIFHYLPLSSPISHYLSLSFTIFHSLSLSFTIFHYPELHFVRGTGGRGGRPPRRAPGSQATLPPHRAQVAPAPAPRAQTFRRQARATAVLEEGGRTSSSGSWRFPRPCASAFGRESAKECDAPRRTHASVLARCCAICSRASAGGSARAPCCASARAIACTAASCCPAPHQPRRLPQRVPPLVLLPRRGSATRNAVPWRRSRARARRGGRLPRCGPGAALVGPVPLLLGLLARRGRAPLRDGLRERAFRLLRAPPLLLLPRRRLLLLAHRPPVRRQALLLRQPLPLRRLLCLPSRRLLPLLPKPKPRTMVITRSGLAVRQRANRPPRPARAAAGTAPGSAARGAPAPCAAAPRARAAGAPPAVASSGSWSPPPNGAGLPAQVAPGHPPERSINAQPPGGGRARRAPSTRGLHILPPPPHSRARLAAPAPRTNRAAPSSTSLIPH